MHGGLRQLIAAAALCGPLSLPLGGCDLSLTGADGEERCLDDFLRDVGSNRERLEREAAQQGIEASGLLKQIFDTTSGVVDALVDCSASDALGGLAAGTGGRFVRVKSPDEGMDKVAEHCRGIEADTLDLVFLVDTTGSMSSSIETVRRRLNDVLASLDGKDVRVGMAFFRDANVDNPWYGRNAGGLVSGTSEASAFLGTIRAQGGGDLPESLYDGVQRTVAELDWRAERRVLVAITDAPPLTGDKTTFGQTEVVALCRAQSVELLTIQVSLF
jgi:hypothetical protein